MIWNVRTLQAGISRQSWVLGNNTRFAVKTQHASPHVAAAFAPYCTHSVKCRVEQIAVTYHLRAVPECPTHGTCAKDRTAVSERSILRSSPASSPTSLASGMEQWAQLSLLCVLEMKSLVIGFHFDGLI